MSTTSILIDFFSILFLRLFVNILVDHMSVLVSYFILLYSIMPRPVLFLKVIQKWIFPRFLCKYPTIQ